VSAGKRGISTRAIHGQPPRSGVPGKPVVAPIVAASTFVLADAAETERVMTEEEYGYLYSRLRNPTVDDVNTVIADLEGAEAALAFSSGMASITAALVTTLERGDTLLAAKQLYGNTYGLIETLVRRLGVEVVYADVTDPDAWNEPAQVRYVETMANPGFPLADIAAIAAGKGEGILVVDNTFASPALCRPLELGADLVCESATKYLNGHHDVTAGVIAGSSERIERARLHLIDTGAVLDPFPAFLLRRGLKTLAMRVQRSSANALALARFLEQHRKVSRVMYAGLETYPQHELALRQLADSGALLAFEVSGGREAAERFFDALELCLRASSLGGVDTVLLHPASTSHRQFSDEQLAAFGISPGLLRVSVGCEDADDIVADFERALERA
jgi:methionine-gamma-lyase